VIDVSILDAVPLLRLLPPEVKAALAARAVVRRFPRGRRLWNAGDEPRGLFVVLEGRVRVVRTYRQRVHVVHEDGPGATLGEIPLFAGGTYPTTAVATEATTCLVFDRQGVAEAMRAQPVLAWVFLERLASRLRVVLDRLSAQGADPVVTRLATYLLGRPTREGGTFTLGGSQQAVAEELGTVREVVVRLLGDLLRGDVIERCGRGIYRMRDEAQLRALASGMVSRVRPSPDPRQSRSGS